MTDPAFCRTEMLLGSEALDRLKAARVAVFGVGGVGGYVVETLARAGVGALDLFDADTVSESNRNRQLLALCSTLGRPKAKVAAERVRDINPACAVTPHVLFYLPETADSVDLRDFTFVVDAIDTVSAKVELAVRCRDAGVPLIASMGTGNKLDPAAFRVTDIFATQNCPLARVMRQKLRTRGVTALPVVWSPELPTPPRFAPPPEAGTAVQKRLPPGSVSFVPPVAGCILAGYVVRAIAGV